MKCVSPGAFAGTQTAVFRVVRVLGAESLEISLQGAPRSLQDLPIMMTTRPRRVPTTDEEGRDLARWQISKDNEQR